MSAKLFIGGLSWNTTNESLNDAFARFGEIAEARVVTDRETGRSRGFGFVTFSNADDANTAREEMNEQELDGRQIRVDSAGDREGGSRGGSGGRDGGFRGGRGGGGDRFGGDRRGGRGGRGGGRGGYDRDNQGGGYGNRRPYERSSGGGRDDFGGEGRRKRFDDDN